MRRTAKWALALFVVLAVIGALNEPDPQSSRPTPASAAVSTPSPSPSPAPTPRPHRARKRSRPAPKSTATPAPVTTPVAFVSCDANIRVRAATTTCPFAENVFYEYFEATFGYPDDVTVQAWSPAASRFFDVDCRGTASIVCGADDGAEIKFSDAALAAYDDDQAERFASSHDIGDDQNADLSDAGVGQNIPNYSNGTGYRVQCADGMYSHSGGRPGACSGHGGVGSDSSGGYSANDTVEPDYGTGNEIPNYDNGTGYRVQCGDGMYSQSGGRPGACSGHGGVG